MSLSIPSADPDDPRYRRRGAMYVPAGEGVTKWVAGDVYTVKATGANTGGAFGFIDATVPPGRGSDPHAHGSESEAFYLLSGELEFLDGDRRFTARQGDFVFVPPGIRHSFFNRGVHSARMVFMYSPGGDRAGDPLAVPRCAGDALDDPLGRLGAHDAGVDAGAQAPRRGARWSGKPACSAANQPCRSSNRGGSPQHAQRNLLARVGPIPAPERDR
jgi:mannose-6-phosphate isomerase-like protein (cupin superfamily)